MRRLSYLEVPLMKRLLLPAIMTITFTPWAFAFGNDEAWTSGFGMGVAEAVITNGPGNQILVACGAPLPGRSVSAISFMLVGDSSDDDEVLLTFDGDAPEGYPLTDGGIGSASHADSGWFERAIEKFRVKNFVNVRFKDGRNATFTLRGASKAISECPSDFSQ